MHVQVTSVAPTAAIARLLATFTVAGALMSTSLVAAQQGQPLDEASRAAAITLGGSGLEAYDAGRYEEASEMLDKAFVVARVPTLGLWSARALMKRGLWVEAAARYDDTARLELAGDAPLAHQRAQTEARDELAALQPQLPTLTITIEGAPLDQVRLTLDGKPLTATPAELKFPANPGPHKLEAQLGTATQVRELSIEPGERELVVVTFDSALSSTAPEPSSNPVDEQPAGDGPSLRTWGWISVGVGAAGIAVGTIGLAGALGKKSDIESSGQCIGEDCAPGASSLIDSYDSFKTVSTIGFVAGGLLAATGVTLILIDTPKGSTEAFIGPGTVGARGYF